MAFTWVAQDDSNAIQNALVDAKGDLIAATANDTPARLAVGNNGETLIADSSTSTGLRWQGSAIGKNAVINGACEIAQRGTAAVTLTAAAFGYPVDRFFAGRSTGTTGMTAQRITSTTLDGFQYAVRVQRTAGDTSTTEMYIGQSFESANSIPFANKSIVVSFWARAGANYSASSNGLSIRFYTGTGTDQAGLGSSFTGTATPISATATLTTSWQRFQYTATLASTATQMQFLAFGGTTGTAGAADFYDITGLQVELGSIATPFSRSQGTIQGELAACQRYYWRTTSSATYNTLTGSNGATSTTQVYGQTKNPTTMRVAPTTIDYSTTYANYQLHDAANNNAAISAIGIDSASCSIDYAGFFVTGTGLTQFRTYVLQAANSNGAYLGFGAEL
jgi:hypothetical protein